LFHSDQFLGLLSDDVIVLQVNAIVPTSSAPKNRIELRFQKEYFAAEAQVIALEIKR
tara:strand:+ start:489 stop:659 length:171 start_codon:yes stop_codon:yes gene_type:complete